MTFSPISGDDNQAFSVLSKQGQRGGIGPAGPPGQRGQLVSMKTVKIAIVFDHHISFLLFFRS